jgi:formate hydrogenlyase subunit 3/multisubunit Na+/H+ antiporter MnhD subunit
MPLLFLLWYGYIYYFTFLVLLTILILSTFRLFYVSLFCKYDVVSFLLKSLLGVFLFFTFTSLTSLYYLLDFFSTFTVIYNLNTLEILTFDYYQYDYLLSGNSLNLNLISVYYFPFIYIFVLVTVLSIIFCLSYNPSELMAFIFYCTLILLAGYLLFFTDSLILFFLAYELLLVPSFFILYNFAKTRRCVEAAYLMFF